MQKYSLPNFDTEAHRGGRGLMPENTIPAMLHAIDLGVSTLEMDLHITADKKVILTHDDHMNPLFTLNAQGEAIDGNAYNLYTMNYANISQFDVGTKFYPAFPKQSKLKAHIPLLSDLIDSVQTYIKVKGKPQVFYNIEIKSKTAGDRKFHPEPEAFVKLVMEEVKQKKISQWVIVQSFDPRVLEVLHKTHSEIKSSFLTSSGSLEENLKRLSFLPTIYSPNATLVTADLIKDCHTKGMKIVPWTVNELTEIKKLKSMGVDGIITDYPDFFNSIAN